MKNTIFVMTVLAFIFSSSAMAAEKVDESKKDAPAQPAGQAWKNVDKELGKGAKKIGNILQEKGIDTKDNSAEIAAKEGKTAEVPAPSPAPAVIPPESDQSFTAKLNRAWFRILGKGDDALNSQRTPENKEPEKSPDPVDP